VNKAAKRKHEAVLKAAAAARAAAKVQKPTPKPKPVAKRASSKRKVVGKVVPVKKVRVFARK
jgi:hypothetical protein